MCLSMYSPLMMVDVILYYMMVHIIHCVYGHMSCVNYCFNAALGYNNGKHTNQCTLKMMSDHIFSRSGMCAYSDV